MSNHELYCGCPEKLCTAMWRFRFVRNELRGLIRSSPLAAWEGNDAAGAVVVHMLCPNPSAEPRGRSYSGAPFYLSCNCGEVDFDHPPRGHQKECAVSIFWKVHQVRQRLDEAARVDEMPTVYGRSAVRSIGYGKVWASLALDANSVPLRAIVEAELREQIESMIDHQILHGLHS